MEILVLHPGALGDIILALPALAFLRRRFSRAKITLAGNLDFLSAAAHDYADSLISLSVVPLHRLYAQETLPAEDIRFWTAFERIVSWTGSGDNRFTSRLTEISRRALVASWRPAPDESRHVSRIFVDTLGPWVGGDAGPTPVPVICPSAESRREAEQWLVDRGWRRGPLVALHPGAGNLEKRWPLDRFRELLTRLIIRRDERVIVVEGPAEYGLCRAMIRGLAPDRVTAAAGLPLELIGGLLKNCSTFIGNDSGIAHLAAGSGCSCLVLFGPTNPSLWAPVGKSVEVLREADGCDKCRGGSGRHSCMENVTVDDVWHRLNNLNGSPRAT